MIKYRHASFIQKLKIAKKFNKFYLNQFIPITKLEARDVDKAKMMYRGYTAGFAIFGAFFSFSYRLGQIALREAEGVVRSKPLIAILNDLVLIFIGF